MRLFIAVLFLFVPIWARGATCPAGQYLEKGECKVCNDVWQSVYCPGDDMRYDCPTTNADYDALAYPDEHLENSREAAWAESANETMYLCYSNIFYRTPDGDEYLMECPYNGENYYCTEKLWYRAGVGRYLSRYSWTSTYNWYRGTKACTNAHPAHSHYSGPGTPDEPVASGGRKDYNDCPWVCDEGYGRHNDECLPLCTAGATKFHIGDYIFNIYKDKLTTPAINIGLSNGTVCYVPLVSGSGKGLNIDYHGTVYHTSD